MGRTYPNEINRVLNSPGGDVGRSIRLLAMEIAAEAAHQADLTYGKHPGDKPRTGKLAKSYQVRVVPGTNQFIVRNTRKYASAMEFGAREHEIKARKKTVLLQFRDRNGVWRRVKAVQHPGSVGRHTLYLAGVVVVKRRLGAVKAG